MRRSIATNTILTLCWREKFKIILFTHASILKSFCIHYEYEGRIHVVIFSDDDVRKPKISNNYKNPNKFRYKQNIPEESTDSKSVSTYL